MKAGLHVHSVFVFLSMFVLASDQHKEQEGLQGGLLYIYIYIYIERERERERERESLLSCF